MWGHVIVDHIIRHRFGADQRPFEDKSLLVLGFARTLRGMSRAPLACLNPASAQDPYRSFPVESIHKRCHGHPSQWALWNPELRKNVLSIGDEMAGVTRTKRDLADHLTSKWPENGFVGLSVWRIGRLQSRQVPISRRFLQCGPICDANPGPEETGTGRSAPRTTRPSGRRRRRRCS